MKTDELLDEEYMTVSPKELLVYTGPGSEYGRMLGERIRTDMGASFWTTDSTRELSEKLKEPKFGTLVALLVASSDRDLTALLELKELLEEARVVLVLPADSWGWIDQAHRLRPRFLSYTDDDQDLVIQVLNKMLSAEYP